jgi:protein-tyrosine phosphatase
MRDQKRVTDYHCHILPGIDDGAETLESALLMARLFLKAGYKEICCTSHLIRGRYEASSAEILDARNQLQAEFNRAKIDIKLLLGREHYLDEFLFDNLKQPLLLEGTNLFLVEIPNLISIELVKEILFKVTCHGYVPLIAHPERCTLLELPTQENNNSRFWNFWSNQKSPIENHQSKMPTNLLTYLQDIGCQFQGNLGSFHGFYGKNIQKKAKSFEQASIYTHLGTDAHNPDHLRQILNIT